MDNPPNIPVEKVADLCRQYRIRRLWLFGSILRDDFRPDSDVDVLVEPGEGVSLLRLGGFQMDMSDLLGRFVHLTTLAGVPPHVRPDLLQKARLAYAA